MVRSDAYRLATIVNAYASCTKALQVRLMLEADSPRLPGRQISMYENLDNALKHLKNISEKRDKLAKDIEKKNKEDKRIRDYAMDHDLKDYIEEVIKRCQEISLQVKDAY
jgi:seryl-tRNA synthetase